MRKILDEDHRSIKLLLQSLNGQKSGWERKENLHPWVRAHLAVRPLTPKTLSILVGLAVKLISLCNHS